MIIHNRSDRCIVGLFIMNQTSGIPPLDICSKPAPGMSTKSRAVPVEFGEIRPDRAPVTRVLPGPGDFCCVHGQDRIFHRRIRRNRQGGGRTGLCGLRCDGPRRRCQTTCEDQHRYRAPNRRIFFIGSPSPEYKRVQNSPSNFF